MSSGTRRRVERQGLEFCRRRRLPALLAVLRHDSGEYAAAHVEAGLGFRSIQALLDAAPKNREREEIIRHVGKIKGITNVHAVRIRSSGAGWFVDMHITMDGEMALTESHVLTEKVEKKVRSILPKSDVTVHVEPNETKKK